MPLELDEDVARNVVKDLKRVVGDRRGDFIPTFENA
jgi:hypothetical protein